MATFQETMAEKECAACKAVGRWAFTPGENTCACDACGARFVYTAIGDLMQIKPLDVAAREYREATEAVQRAWSQKSSIEAQLLAAQAALRTAEQAQERAGGILRLAAQAAK